MVPEHTALGVCLERMHRAFSELLVLAQRYNPVETGPRRVRSYLNHIKQWVGRSGLGFSVYVRRALGR